MVVPSLGCTPSVERVCSHKVRLSEDRFGKMDPVSHKAGLRHCIELANREKKENLARYKCRSACVLDARHLDEIDACERGCS
jgi:hypothetical protein